jgi:hypothetical protein
MLIFQEFTKELYFNGTLTYRFGISALPDIVFVGGVSKRHFEYRLPPLKGLHIFRKKLGQMK